MATIKICSRCKEVKELNDFYQSSREGCRPVASNCKKCDSKRHKEHYLENTEKMKERSRKSYLKNQRRCLEYAREYRKSHPGLVRALNRKHPLRIRARNAVNNAIAGGRIKKRNICEICLNSPTHCHHGDYSKPMDFIELCRECHYLLHRQLRNSNPITT